LAGSAQTRKPLTSAAKACRENSKSRAVMYKRLLTGSWSPDPYFHVGDSNDELLFAKKQ
jgi:hypothetical protein